MSVGQVESARRRVLLVVRTLGLGGMERMTVNLANALARQGHDVHLMVFKNRVELKPDPAVHVHVVDLDLLFRLTVFGAVWDFVSRTVARLFVRRAKNVFYSFYFSRMFRLWLWWFELRHGRVDLIVARGYGSFQGLSGITDPRLVRVVVNEQWEAPESPWHRRYYRGTFHGAKVAFNSRQLEEKFLRMCGQMGVKPALTRVMNNPTDIERILRDAEGPSPITGPYIVNVGRLEKAKNQQLLVDAFALISRRVPHRLVLVGKGALQGALASRAQELGIADRVIFAGQQQNPYPWIRHASLFVLSSLHEGLPNVVIEAMICRTPVVVTRGGGGTVELMQGDMAEFVAEMEPESLAEKMLSALDRCPRADETRMRAFSMDEVARQFLALGDTAVSGK
jgi:glycosyltransferase involved in cell wall biosynthesis